MKREIEGRVYDTNSATLIASHAGGSTHIHRVISLYCSSDGDYFLLEEREVHGVDGAILTPCTDSMAREWLEEHGNAELASKLLR